MHKDIALIELNDPEYTEEEKTSIIYAEDGGDLEEILRELAKIQKEESSIVEIKENIMAYNCVTTTNEEYDKIIETFEFFEEDD